MADFAGVPKWSVYQINFLSCDRRGTMTPETLPDIFFAMTSAQGLFQRRGGIGFGIQPQPVLFGQVIDGNSIRRSVVPDQVRLKKLTGSDDDKNRLGDFVGRAFHRHTRMAVETNSVGVGVAFET